MIARRLDSDKTGKLGSGTMLRSAAVIVLIVALVLLQLPEATTTAVAERRQDEQRDSIIQHRRRLKRRRRKPKREEGKGDEKEDAEKAEDVEEEKRPSAMSYSQEKNKGRVLVWKATNVKGGIWGHFIQIKHMKTMADSHNRTLVVFPYTGRKSSAVSATICDILDLKGVKCSTDATIVPRKCFEKFEGN